MGVRREDREVARLREQIERANNAYYINDAPEISDAEPA